MPPKKVVDVPKVGTGDEAALAKEQAVRDGISIEDLSLPKSIVTRLAKGALPPNTQVQANAVTALTKSATVFVNYLASHANEHALGQNRKTLSTADVFAALDQLEFPEWKARLEPELAKWHAIQANKKDANKKKAADKAAGEEDTETQQTGKGPEGQPATKKAKLEGDSVMKGKDAEQTADEGDEGDEDETHVEDETHGEDEDEDDVEEEEEEERLQIFEETQQVDGEDEALDNGEDSD